MASVDELVETAGGRLLPDNCGADQDLSGIFAGLDQHADSACGVFAQLRERLRIIDHDFSRVAYRQPDFVPAGGEFHV